jgi:peptidoglycan/xylan/chitin deacetylase (PgdA/CDA1 family)
VTFDDGYADVFHHALPILQREGCPATLFVTTGAIEHPEIFWWDILTRIVLETPQLPACLSLDIAGAPQTFHVQDEVAGTVRDGTVNRRTLHDQLHGLLRLIEPQIRQEALHRLAEWAGTDANARVRDSAMTPEQLRQFAASDGMEIGAHTLTHPSLPSLQQDDLTREVAISRRQCESLIDRPVSGFAYPFGDYDTASKATVRVAGLAYACSTVSREIGPHVDGFAIPRLLAADWNEAGFRREVLAHG